MCARSDLELEAAARDRRREILHRIRMLRKQTEEPPPEQEVHVDFLAVATAHQRRLLEKFYQKVDELKKRYPSIGVLSRSTQPAHVVMVLAVLVISATLGQSSATSPSPSPLTNLAYLAAFSVHLGNQFWMTFVSGLALYFNLPRHDFGAVQKILFPKYFSINSFLSLVTLISFTKLHNATSMKTPEKIQVAALSLCFLVELMIRLYIVPSVIRLITEKTQLEAAAGVGREVGHFSPGPLLACPFYKHKHLTFRRLHVLVAVGNIATMACASLHLYYISQHWVCNMV